VPRAVLDWISSVSSKPRTATGIDMRAVKRRIHWGRELFELREMPFDRFNFRTQSDGVARWGVEAVEIAQSFLHPEVEAIEGHLAEFETVRGPSESAA